MVVGGTGRIDFYSDQWCDGEQLYDDGNDSWAKRDAVHVCGE